MYKTKLSRGILPLLLMIALLLPQSAFAAAPAIPAFDGAAAAELKRNVPTLLAEDIDTQEHVTYSPLDELGRPGPVTACLGRASLPTGLRSDDVSALPVGWVTVRYEDGYLYSLCHLLSPALGGDASAAENVFTGTRYLQNESMRPFEDRIADYLARTQNHVLYRATPVYSGDNLVPDGVQLEALSVEDGGKSVCFNVFLYNIQPGVAIDYRTGESARDASVAVDFTAKELLALRLFPEPSEMLAPQHGSFDALSEEYNKGTTNQSSASSNSPAYLINTDNPTYLLNTNTMKIHTLTCREISKIKEENKVLFYGSYDQIFVEYSSKYTPCGVCKPTANTSNTLTVSQTASPTPRPVITSAPTAKPKSDGNSLLSGILSSALSTDSTMVWISGMDHCYHSTDSCTNVDAASAYQKTLDWAKAIGYQACRNCW